MALPFGVALACFAVFTPLTVYHLANHAEYTKKMSAGKCLVDKNLVNLYRRLIIYTLIVALACVGFAAMGIFNDVLDDDRDQMSYQRISCLVLEFQFLDSQQQAIVMKDGTIEEVLSGECPVDPSSLEFGDYTMVIATCSSFLIAMASLTFSCSRKKWRQWKTCTVWTITCRVCRGRRCTLSECVQVINKPNIKLSRGGNSTTTLQMEAHPVSVASASPTLNATSSIAEKTELNNMALTLANNISVKNGPERSDIISTKNLKNSTPNDNL